MTLQQLTYLVTVADCGNITEAAEKLFISQPSLSAAIHNLEKEMGVTAFTRSNKGVTVTREGEELLSFARMLLEQADNMKEHFGNGERRTPKFSVSCQHYSFAVNAFVDLIKKYDADVSICNLYDVIDENECIRNKENGIREYSRLDILKEVLLDKNIQSYAWNKLYEKELFDEIKYPIGKKYEDIGTTFYVFEKCNKIVVTSEPEYYYLKRSDSLVNNVTESTVLDYTEIIIQRYLYTKENIKELKKYNNYYLAKTLITAHNDIELLGSISEKMQEKYKELYNLVYNIMKNDREDIEELFNAEQKKAIKNLIKI